MWMRGAVASTATVRVITERLPAWSLAISFTVVRPSGSLGSSANAPALACTMTRLPAVTRASVEPGSTRPLISLAECQPDGRLVERQLRAVRVDVDRERRVDAVAEDAARLRRDVHSVRAVRDVGELELEALARRAQYVASVLAVDRRAQGAEVACVLDRHEHLRRGGAVPLPRRPGDLRALRVGPDCEACADGEDRAAGDRGDHEGASRHPTNLAAAGSGHVSFSGDARGGHPRAAAARGRPRGAAAVRAAWPRARSSATSSTRPRRGRRT